MLPQLLPNDTIDLEGNELRVIRIGQADTAESTVLHVPSLAAVVTGDLAYNEVHMMTAETGDDHRGITAVPSGLLPHRGRGDHRSRDRRPHGRDSPRLGQSPHHLVLLEISHRTQRQLAARVRTRWAGSLPVPEAGVEESGPADAILAGDFEVLADDTTRAVKSQLSQDVTALYTQLTVA